MILLTILIYLIVYNFPLNAEKQSLKDELKKSLGISKNDNKSYLDDIEKKIKNKNKAEKDAFFKCWLDNVKPNSSASHAEVVALYCSNKTGYKP